MRSKGVFAYSRSTGYFCSGCSALAPCRRAAQVIIKRRTSQPLCYLQILRHRLSKGEKPKIRTDCQGHNQGPPIATSSLPTPLLLLRLAPPSPLPIALVDGRRRAQPGSPDTLGARKAKVGNQAPAEWASSTASFAPEPRCQYLKSRPFRRTGASGHFSLRLANETG